MNILKQLNFEQVDSFIIIFVYSNHKSAILCGVLTNSDEFLITGTYDRLINVLRVENGDMVHSSEKHFDSVTALAISLDDTILISGRCQFFIYSNPFKTI